MWTLIGLAVGVPLLWLAARWLDRRAVRHGRKVWRTSRGRSWLERDAEARVAMSPASYLRRAAPYDEGREVDEESRRDLAP